MVMQTTTKTGCRVTLYSQPAFTRHMGEGVMLALDMAVTNDPRHAEVYLDEDAALEVYRALGQFLSQRRIVDVIKPDVNVGTTLTGYADIHLETIHEEGEAYGAADLRAKVAVSLTPVVYEDDYTPTLAHYDVLLWGPTVAMEDDRTHLRMKQVPEA